MLQSLERDEGRRTWSELGGHLVALPTAGCTYRCKTNKKGIIDKQLNNANKRNTNWKSYLLQSSVTKITIHKKLLLIPSASFMQKSLETSDKKIPNFSQKLLPWAISTEKTYNISHHYHRLNGSSSPGLTATSLFYGKAKNLTPTKSKPLTWLDKIWYYSAAHWHTVTVMRAISPFVIFAVFNVRVL